MHSHVWNGIVNGVSLPEIQFLWENLECLFAFSFSILRSECACRFVDTTKWCLPCARPLICWHSWFIHQKSWIEGSQLPWSLHKMKGFSYDMFQLFSIAQLLTAEIHTTKIIVEGGVMEHTYKESPCISSNILNVANWWQQYIEKDNLAKVELKNNLRFHKPIRHSWNDSLTNNIGVLFHNC